MFVVVGVSRAGGACPRTSNRLVAGFNIHVKILSSLPGQSYGAGYKYQARPTYTPPCPASQPQIGTKNTRISGFISTAVNLYII